MNATSISDFMKANKVLVHKKIRTNANGYPFVTFLTPDESGNKGMNIYFTKHASNTLALKDGDPLPASKLVQIVEVALTSTGEVVNKIGLIGEGSYSEEWD